MGRWVVYHAGVSDACWCVYYCPFCCLAYDETERKGKGVGREGREERERERERERELSLIHI